MTLLLQNLRDDIRDSLGLDEDDLDNTKVDRLIRRSWVEVQNNFNLREKDAVHTINTVAGTHEYNLASDHDSFIRVTVRNPTSLLEIPLDRVETDEFAENHNTRADNQAIPTTYTPREAGKVWINPVPDQIYVITVYYKAVLPDFGSNIEPEKLYDIIKFGAIWRGFFNGGDHNRAVSAKAFQSSMIKDHKPQEEKDEQDSRMAGLEVIREDNY